ncbi:unnamed protein product [Clonostachys chloroleuca]|uniref:Uncharacterized protein n=1 Tax=Clonostachys chloroleuca TaxID=1926264 RepID=A0AA35MHL7_9HYPO|nr:unnamed protein product [Clonostachys chloroleuca]
MMPSTGLVKSASTGQISNHILPRDVSMVAVLGLFELHAGYAIQRWMDQGPEEDHWSALNPPPPGESLAEIIANEMANLSFAEDTTNGKDAT